MEHGGIAIYAKSNLNIHKVDLDTNFNSLETGAISLLTNTGEILIVACYRSPTGHNNITVNDIKGISEAVKNYDKFIVVGDFNAHHPFWGDDNSCANDAHTFTPSRIVLISNQRKKQEKLRYCSRVFEWNELLLSAIGLYPGKFSFARFYLNLAYFTAAMGLEYLDLVLSLGDFERVVLNLTENAAFTHIYAYTLSLWLGNREIGQLLGQVASDFAADYTDQEIATLRRYYFRARVFIEFLFVNLFTTASSYFMQPFTGQMDQILGYVRGSSANSSIVYQLPYRFHAFHRVDEPASYLWTSAAYAPFVLVTFFNQSSGECCLIALVYHVAAQMAVLASRIRGIEPGNNNCTEQLANCLRRHARLLRMGQQINEVFSAMLLVHLTGIILLVCLVGYQLLWENQKKLDKIARVFQWNRRLMSFLGLWPDSPNVLLFVLTFGYYSYDMLLEYMDLLVYIDRPQNVMLNLMENMAFTEIFVRILMLRVWNRQFGELLAAAAKDFEAKGYDTDEEVAKFVPFYAKAKSFMKLLISNTAFTATSFYVKPLLGQLGPADINARVLELFAQVMDYFRANGEPNSTLIFLLPYRFYVLYELDDAPTYFWTYGSYLPFVFISGFGQSAADCLMVTLVYHLSGQLAVLSMRIEKIDGDAKQLRRHVARHAKLLRIKFTFP
ncbi:unnamed protein product [Trichogramma brassicae]|uniref:Endonuclease/exonuclease/phosphatase domain-containing protein n=1 Tax=Trichogramma brassicae TaxID=86971 RepID=A0A6H5IGS4_9HYME|nr:unnamed protein product [Trichogramma brassicae]